MSANRLKVEERGEIAIVKFIDRRILEVPVVQKIIGELTDLTQKKILLNWIGVEFLSSAMLNTLQFLHNRCSDKGGKLVMCNVHEDILEMFEITHLDRLFIIFKEEEEALQAF